MKKYKFTNNFKESYLQHLHTNSIVSMKNSKRNKTIEKNSEKGKPYKPLQLPPLSRSKSPIVMKLNNPDLQKQYEDIKKIFSFHKANKTNRT